MRTFSFAVVALVCGTTCFAQTAQQFPYDATVEIDGVYVRSGPGEKYYPTGRLARGQRVRVTRHDAGGWYRIMPPPGSFSWIPKRAVRVNGKVGEILDGEGGVVAFVGTEFGSEASVFQVRFAPGQRVEIIGEGTIQTGAGREAMLKIKPPRREYRYVPGRAVVPGGRSGRETPIPAPRRNDPTHRVRSPVNRRTEPSARPIRPEAPASAAVEYRRLQQIDASFRDMVLRPKAEWDFRQIEAAYRELEKSARSERIGNQVRIRMPALERYKRKKREYDDFVSLTSETNRRDAELLKMSTGVTGSAPPAAELLPKPPPASSLRAPKPGESEVKQTPPPQGFVRVDKRHPQNRRFVGAGLIRQLTGSRFEYALGTHDGRILAFIDAPGFDLSKFVDQAVGVEGERFRDAEGKRPDQIRVTGAVPIRLKKRPSQ